MPSRIGRPGLITMAVGATITGRRTGIRTRASAPAHARADAGADAGDEFGRAEGLHRVVVGAEFEADDAVGLEATGRHIFPSRGRR